MLMSVYFLSDSTVFPEAMNVDERWLSTVNHLFPTVGQIDCRSQKSMIAFDYSLAMNE